MIADCDYQVLKEMMQEVSKKIDGCVFFKFEIDACSIDGLSSNLNLWICGGGFHWNEDFENIIDAIKWMNKLIIRLNKKPNNMMQSQNAIGENENAIENGKE
jgi:hypothetical protein